MKEIFVRMERCQGCRTCELVCRVEHSTDKSLLGALGETPVPRRRLFVELDGSVKIPVLCRHCEDAPCLNACISGAIYRDAKTNAVMSNPDKCIGCWTCIMVCPYGVINRSLERRVSVKCDLCPDRETPACVDSCPTKALVYTEPEEFSHTKRQSYTQMVSHIVQA
ncbi:MAG: 4Fe-4S dicluster domain-containing protein [Dehalococcoidia bacterium]